MKTENVQAKRQAEPDKVYSIPFEVPESLEEAEKAWGPDVTLSNAIQNSRITLQSAMRRGMEKGMTNEQLIEQLKGWKPGVAAGLKVDPEQAIMARAKADPEFRAKLIKDLQAEAKAQAGK